MINFKILSLATVATLALGFAPAQANDLMNNNASGFVEGDIVSGQENRGGYSPISAPKEILVGGIAVNGAAFQNTASGSVSGDILQLTDTYSLGSEIHVGSIKAEDAANNTARGSTGSITQLVGAWSQAVINVGSINADDGSAFNNDAEGFVSGDIYQDASQAGSSSLINVGAITSSSSLR